MVTESFMAQESFEKIKHYLICEGRRDNRSKFISRKNPDWCEIPNLNVPYSRHQNSDPILTLRIKSKEEFMPSIIKPISLK